MPKTPKMTAVARANTDVRDAWCQIVNVPNSLTALRVVGSLVLIALAMFSQSIAFICVYVFLVVTDWLDGKLAILLHQRTQFGSRLDSFADASMYAALLSGMCLLKWEFITENFVWIVPVVSTYVLTVITSFLKFRRLPSYHTYAAKTSANLFNVAVVCIFFNGIQWPFFVAMGAIAFTNLEETGITLVLQKPNVDVRTIYHALKLRGKSTAQPISQDGGRYSN